MKTKIKRDEEGLYVRCDGWIGRVSSKGSRFTVGDAITASHPPGSFIYVREQGNKDRKSWETWSTTTSYWWHPVEGRGAHAKTLRERDIEEHPSLYSEKVSLDIERIELFTETGYS